MKSSAVYKASLGTLVDTLVVGQHVRNYSDCLYENLMSNNFRKNGCSENNINCKLKLQSKGLS